MNPENRKAFLPSRQQREALLRLMEQDAYDERPCRDAARWDVPESAGMADRAYIRAQVADRARQCAACPVLGECAAYLATGPKVHGVIAGELRVVKS